MGLLGRSGIWDEPWRSSSISKSWAMHEEAAGAGGQRHGSWECPGTLSHVPTLRTQWRSGNAKIHGGNFHFFFFKVILIGLDRVRGNTCVVQLFIILLSPECEQNHLFTLLTVGRSFYCLYQQLSKFVPWSASLLRWPRNKSSMAKYVWELWPTNTFWIYLHWEIKSSERP